MKILIFSDSHLSLNNIIKMVELENPDIVLCGGDHSKDAEELSYLITGPKFYIVRGNCDFYDSRNDDILIRWGGEEFIMILKVSSENGLKIALENLRKTIENSKINNLPQITCSFGGTLYKNNELITDTIKRADESLYVAKNQGKNRIIIK